MVVSKQKQQWKIIFLKNNLDDGQSIYFKQSRKVLLSSLICMHQVWNARKSQQHIICIGSG